MGGGGHVEPPRTEDALAGEIDRALLLAHQARDPRAQSEHVVLAQALGVARLEALRFGRFDRDMQWPKPSVGEDVLVDEGVALPEPAFDPLEARAMACRVHADDAVIEQESSRAQRTMQCGEVRREMVHADVLHHADAGDLVELQVAKGAIVADLHAAAVAQPCRRNARAGERRLGVAEGDPERRHAVMLHRMHDESAPSAADVE